MGICHIAMVTTIGRDCIDINAKIDCGVRIILRIHNLDFAMKTTQMESVSLSSISKQIGLK